MTGLVSDCNQVLVGDKKDDIKTEVKSEVKSEPSENGTA